MCWIKGTWEDVVSPFPVAIVGEGYVLSMTKENIVFSARLFCLLAQPAANNATKKGL